MILVFFFFFKQKTAYEIKECDWSSDVCSSDLEVLADIVREIGKILDTRSGHERAGKAQLRPARVSTERMPTTRKEFLGREDQLKLIDAAWENPKTHFVAIIGSGGVGKSALVNQWLARMAERDWAGAESVFCWSFYSQGFREGAEVSADQFVEEEIGRASCRERV